MATKAKENRDEQKGEASDGPLLDLSDAAVKKMIKAAKKRGYVTYEELNEVLPSDQVTSEKIEDTMSMLSDMGINVIESEEADDAEAEDAATGGELVAARFRRGRHQSQIQRADPTGPTIRCACICARWGRSNFCRAKARSRLPSASRPAARR
jgi:RNA polymerase primary sigma factor